MTTGRLPVPWWPLMKQVMAISVAELRAMSLRMYGDMVKAVVDVELKLLVVDAELHVDEEQYLLEHGSQQSALWGINLHPDKYDTDEFVEFDSMVNIRPSQNNMSRNVDDPSLRDRIAEIIAGIVTA